MPADFRPRSCWRNVAVVIWLKASATVVPMSFDCSVAIVMNATS